MGESRYPDDLLDGLRCVGDPVPDGIIEDLVRNRDIEVVNTALHNLTNNSDPIPHLLPLELANWLEANDELPAWAESERLDRAATFFAKHGVSISLVLSTSSLVECYAARKGVKALACSYRLGHNAYRRIAETAQFVLLVMAHGALDRGGQGRWAIQKVRLMHSAIRYFIRQSGRWDENELGAPICQEDMLGTLLTFSWTLVRDLRRLGVHVSSTEAEDLLYFWRAVGELLGILSETIPARLDEAEELVGAIARRHQGPSPEGIAMTRALLEFHNDLMPGHIFHGLAPAIIRRLVGQQIGDWMEVPRSHWEALVCHDGALGHVEKLVDKWGKGLLAREMIALTGYERAGFDIPTHLRDAWELDSHSWDDAPELALSLPGGREV